MSQENVEIVEAIWAEFVRGRFPEDRFTEAVTWSVAADEPEGGPEAGPIRGPAEVQRMLASFWDTVDRPWVEADEFVDGGDHVVVRWRGGGIGRASGIAVEWPETHVYTVRDGKVAEVREYRDFAEALEAVGLSE
jgi:ketosteroid isomerase-like protein